MSRRLGGWLVKKTVLIVDDTPDCLEPLARFLRSSGYKPLLAASAAEALSLLQHSAPSLILLDLMMPEMDGFAFLRAHRDGPRKHIPVIVISALSDHAVLDEVKELGAARSLVKAHYSADELLQCIDEVSLPAA